MLLTTFSSEAGVHRVYLDRSACTETVDRVLDLKVRFVHCIAFRAVRLPSHGRGQVVTFDLIFVRSPNGKGEWSCPKNGGNSHMPVADREQVERFFSTNHKALVRWVTAMPAWKVEGEGRV